MDSRERMLAEIEARRRGARFIRQWAKFEIFLGLFGVGAGVLLGLFAMRSAAVDFFLAGGALAMMVLGGYLAMAGQRSHLYQSTFEQTGFLFDEIQGRTSHKSDAG